MYDMTKEEYNKNLKLGLLILVSVWLQIQFIARVLPIQNRGKLAYLAACYDGISTFDFHKPNICSTTSLVVFSLSFDNKNVEFS